jgi:hypothetical protein
VAALAKLPPCSASPSYRRAGLPRAATPQLHPRTPEPRASSTRIALLLHPRAPAPRRIRVPQPPTRPAACIACAPVLCSCTAREPLLRRLNRAAPVPALAPRLLHRLFLRCACSGPRQHLHSSSPALRPWARPRRACLRACLLQRSATGSAPTTPLARAACVAPRPAALHRSLAPARPGLPSACLRVRSPPAEPLPRLPLAPAPPAAGRPSRARSRACLRRATPPPVQRPASPELSRRLGPLAHTRCLRATLRAHQPRAARGAVPPPGEKEREREREGEGGPGG